MLHFIVFHGTSEKVFMIFFGKIFSIVEQFVVFFIMKICVFRCLSYHFRSFFVDFSLFFRYFLNKKNIAIR